MRLYPLLASAALATTLIAPTAHAAPSGILAPVTQWAVTKVDGGSGGYCALARRFKQNTILTMARNANGETSIALDLQTIKFKTGENMKVVLDPGAGAQRSYYISPVSAQAIVVRLGRDEDFVSAVQQTGYLRIEVAGQTYSFDVSDIEAGTSKLENCVGNAAGGMREARNTSSDEIESLRRDVQGLKKENERLASIMTEAPRGVVAMPDEVVTERLEGQVRTLEQRNDTLRSRAQRPSVSGVAAGQSVSDEVALGNLARENQKLSKMLAGLTVRGSDDRQVRNQIDSLQGQNRTLREDMAQRSEEGSWGRSQSEISNLKEQNRRMHDAMNRRPVDLVVAQTEPAAGEEPPIKNIMEEVIDEPVASPPPIAAPAADGVPSADDLMARIREKDAQLAEMSSLQAEVESLKAKNAELEKQLLDSVQNKDGVKALNDRIAQLESENAALTQQLEEAKKAGGGADPAKLKALEDENAQLRQQIASHQDKEQEVSALRQRLEELQKENETLKAGAPASGAAATPEQASEIEALKKENEDLRHKIAKLSESTDSQALQDQLAKEQQHVQELEAQLKAAQEAKPAEASAGDTEEVAQLKSQLDEKTKQAEDLQQKLSAAEATAAPQDEGAAAAEVAALEKKVEEATKRADSAEAELKAAQEAKPITQEDLDKQVAAVKKKAEEEKQVEMASLANENMSLKKKLMERSSNAAPAAAAPAVAAKVADSPVQEVNVEPPPVPPQATKEEPPSNIVASDWPPEEPKVDNSMTEAQKQEAAMINSMQQEPKAVTPPAKAAENINWNEKKDAPVAAAPLAPPAEAPAEQAVARAAPGTAFSVQDVVVNANIVPQGAVQKVEKASGPDKTAYQWKVGGIFGSAEQRPMTDASKFDDMVKAYLEKTHKRCAGDFAASPDQSMNTASGRIDTYEIACVGKAVNSTASLVFVNKANSFTIFAHETSADQMSDAMEMRDRLVKSLSGS